jgi:hypothetical protein
LTVDSGPVAAVSSHRLSVPATTGLGCRPWLRAYIGNKIIFPPHSPVITELSCLIERGVSRSLRRAERGAVAVFGVQRRTPCRSGPRCEIPADEFRHGFLGGSAVTPCQRPGADRGHQRWIKGPPQDAHSKPQTPRAGRRRTSGLAALNSGIPRRRKVSRSAGLLRPRYPARPRCGKRN